MRNFIHPLNQTTPTVKSDASDINSKGTEKSGAYDIGADTYKA